MIKNIIKTIISTCIPLNIDNVDTDQIIPSRFLKATTRIGFGENLFRDWRFDNKNEPIKDFILNNSNYKGKILVVGKNFGCGSSREHAAWTIVDYGFKAIVGNSFADIFKNNALNNNLLPVEVSENFLKELFAEIQKNPKMKITIDLPKQSISFDKLTENFEINPYKKTCLTEGLDDVDYLLNLKSDIETYEKKRINDFS